MDEFLGLPPDLKDKPYNLYVLVLKEEKRDEEVKDCIRQFIDRFGNEPKSIYRQEKRIWLGPLEKGKI